MTQRGGEGGVGAGGVEGGILRQNGSPHCSRTRTERRLARAAGIEVAVHVRVHGYARSTTMLGPPTYVHARALHE